MFPAGVDVAQKKVRINYDYHMVWIHFIRTQAEYDKIDASKM